MITKIYKALCAGLASCVLTVGFTACSDVDLAPATYSETVSNLIYEHQEGSRDVSLRWDNPTMSGLSKIMSISPISTKLSTPTSSRRHLQTSM